MDVQHELKIRIFNEKNPTQRHNIIMTQFNTLNHTWTISRSSEFRSIRAMYRSIRAMYDHVRVIQYDYVRPMSTVA